MVQAGLGVAILPRLAVDQEIADGRLAAIDVSGLALRRIWAIQRTGKFAFASMRALLSHLTKELQ